MDFYVNPKKREPQKQKLLTTRSSRTQCQAFGLPLRRLAPTLEESSENENREMDDAEVKNSVGKWGAIGLIVGGVLPYLIGGWIENFSLITALAGAFIFGWIAMDGADSQVRDISSNDIRDQQQRADLTPPQPAKEEINKPEVGLIISDMQAGLVEDVGFLRRQFTYKVNNNDGIAMATVDYNGIMPSGSNNPKAVVIIFKIPALNITSGTEIEYISTERAAEVIHSIDSKLITSMLKGVMIDHKKTT